MAKTSKPTKKRVVKVEPQGRACIFASFNNVTHASRIGRRRFPCSGEESIGCESQPLSNRNPIRLSTPIPDKRNARKNPFRSTKNPRRPSRGRTANNTRGLIGCFPASFSPWSLPCFCSSSGAALTECEFRRRKISQAACGRRGILLSSAAYEPHGEIRHSAPPRHTTEPLAIC